MEDDTTVKVGLGIGISAIILYLLTRCKNDLYLDPDIIRDNNIFTSLGGLGHRIWIPNKYSGEGNTYDGKTALDACDISTKTITIDIENLSSTINAGVEMNCSYGFTKTILPGERITLISTPTSMDDCPLRTISQTEQPEQPFARANKASCNIWFHNGKVQIHSIKIE